MLPRKDWAPHLFFLLLIRLFLAIGFGILALYVVSDLVKRSGHTLSPAMEVFLGGLAVHGSGLVVIHLFVRHTAQSWKQAFGLNLNPSRAVVNGAVAALVVLPVAYALQSLCAKVLPYLGVKPAAQSTVNLLLKDPSLQTRGLIALIAVLLAPVVEESLFRGLLFPFLRDLTSRRLAYCATALVFGLIHVNAAAFLPLTLFGAVLAWLYERTGNLLASMTAHAVFNLAPFVLLALGVEMGP